MKALVFDLGAVLLNISYQKTIKEFEKLGVKNFQKQFSKAEQSGVFEQFEKGEISEAEWIVEMQNLAGDLSAQAIKKAWNDMLLDFPEHRLWMLEELAEKYPIYLLSNTNITHIEYCRVHYKSPVDWNHFEGLFDELFLSYEVGMRKPDHEIFLHVQTELGLAAKDIWYVDDSPQHVETALELGWDAHHLKEGVDVSELVKATLNS